jgi:hypothetical protein
MLNEDNICIKYLMNELDPSEAMLVEKAMMEDQDLLIEIECLRETLKKVDKLPAVQPPQNISEQIIKKAVEQRSEAQKLSLQAYKLQQPKYYAAAAMLLAGVTLGALTFDVYPGALEEYYGQRSKSTTTQSISNTKTSSDRSVPVNATFTSTQNSDSNVQPWVDHNDVLHYQESEQDGFSFINDSIMKESMKKLKPINEPVHFYARPKSVHLTGAPR